MTETNSNSKLHKILMIRGICNFIVLIFIILACFGFSWGEYLSPVQRSGVAVSFVFDISNSMMATDGPENTTRLKAASVYAQKLLDKMNGISTSVVLAKGDGIVAVPLTEDYALIESLLDVLSPKLMTVPGTSLGKGIIAAKSTFPQNFAHAGRIFVFTDGEETDGELENALEECVKNGIPVSIIGFGSENEKEILLPDNKTKVMTALRSKNIASSIEKTSSKLKRSKVQGNITYINSNERGSASSLLRQLAVSGLNNEKILSYETKAVPRYKLFLFLAVIFFVAGYIITEFDFNRFFGKIKKISPVLICFLFIGCYSDTVSILDGTIAWHKKEYKKSVAQFKTVAEADRDNDKDYVKNYARYNLGTSYAVLNEDAAALQQFGKIPENSSKAIKYATFYNTGVILFKSGKYEEARSFFRKAIEADSTKIEAKINMELSMKKIQGDVRKNQVNAIPAAENNSRQPEVEDALFQHIKENDQKQWKNSETKQSVDYSNDY